jgi:hypothetical protein
LSPQTTVALACFVLALMSKEECVAFPLFLLLLPGFPRALITAMLAMSAGVGAYTWWAASTVTGSQAGPQSMYSPLTYLAAQGFVILRNLWLLMLPTGPFTVEPDIPLGQVWAWLFVIAIVAVAVKRRAVWLLGGIILLLPSSSVFPTNDLTADRRMYLPIVAFAAALASIPILHRRYAIAAVAGILAILGFRAIATLEIGNNALAPRSGA